MNTKQLSLFPEITETRQDKIQDLVQQIETRELPDLPIAVSYGGGVNSTAMLIAARMKRINIAHIIFADTGNEHPDTYAFIDLFDKWLQSPWHDYPPLPEITVVRYSQQKPGKREKIKRSPLFLGKLTPIYLIGWTIETCAKQSIIPQNLGEKCLILESLPSKAYGYGACSEQWKIRPIEKHLRDLDKSVIRWIGIHANETGRLLNKNGIIKPLEDNLGYIDYPLIRWGLDQEDCVRLCQMALGFVPQKSACWFCPNTKPSEVLTLKKSFPELYELGCFMEEQSKRHDKRHVGRGLGRSFSWREIDKLPQNKRLEIEMMAAARKCSCTDQ